MEEFLILWRLELKLWRFFGEKNWGGFWRFSAKKGALSDLELLSTLVSLEKSPRIELRILKVLKTNEETAGFHIFDNAALVAFSSVK